MPAADINFRVKLDQLDFLTATCGQHELLDSIIDVFTSQP